MKATLLLIMAVALVGGCGKSAEEKAAKAKAEAAAEAKAGAWVSDPNDPNNVKIEKAIRYELYSHTGELTKADLEKVTELTFLESKLTDVKDLEKLTQLTKLFFNANQLTNVKVLEKLTQLEELDLSDNQLTDVKGLENLTQLKDLDLSKNQLTSVKGLEKFTQLKYLWLTGNPDLTKAQIAELQKALPKCKIHSNAKK
jgi:Leucine-rich repeat (LRR) protein